MSPVRVAVIGAGQIAQRGHLPGLLAAGAEITALCDNSLPQLEEIGAAFHVRQVYRDWRTMLDAGGFEAVTICTPPFLHAEMAIEYARRGLHVLVEKPMAVNLAQCDQMITASEQAGTILMISHNQRFMAAHRLAKEILESGLLGKLYLAHGVFGHGGPEVWSPSQQWYFRPDRAGAGVIADLGYHKLDLIRWLTGQEITAVGALGATFEKQTLLEDSAVMIVHLAGNTLATLQVSWVFRPDWENSLIIRGERGVLSIPTEASQPLRLSYISSSGQIIESTHRCASSDTSGWFGAIRAFLTAIEQRAPAPIDGKEGRAVMAAVLAATQSIQKQTIIPVTEVETIHD